MVAGVTLKFPSWQAGPAPVTAEVLRYLGEAESS